MKSELNIVGRNMSQVDVGGLLLPLWPDASHFKTWEYAPCRWGRFFLDAVDLYWHVDSGGHLRIGIQLSEEDGNYETPNLIGTWNALHELHENEASTVQAYKIACAGSGIIPTMYREPTKGKYELIN